MRAVTVTTALIAAAATALLAVSPAWAGGGGHGDSQCQTTSSGPQLAMLDNCFDGIVHTVDGDVTLTVANLGELPHTITAADGTFDSGSLAPGETFKLDLDRTGDIPIYCTLHGTADGSGMAGLLRVDARGSENATSAATSSGSEIPISEATVLLVGAALGAVAHKRWDDRRTTNSWTN